MRMRSEVRREKSEREKPEILIDVPNDPINEQVLIAAALVDDDVRRRLVKAFPTPDAFYADKHKAIYAGLIELERLKLAYDPATLQRLSPDVDIRILETLATARPDVPANLDFHIDNLAWDAQRAQATGGPISALLEAVQNPKESHERVKALARQVGECFEGEFGRARYLRNPKEVVRAAMASLHRRVAGEAYYPYGIPGLDYYDADALNAKNVNIGGTRRIRPGASPGTISMITALSGSGKSSFAAHVILGLARQKRRILVGAWEENAPVTIELLATLSLKWSRSRMLDGKSNRLKDEDSLDYDPLSPEELVQVEEKMHAISKYVKFFDNPFQRNKGRSTGRKVSNDDHLDIIHDHIAESGCNVFIADLWQRCLVETKPEDERHALFRQLAIAEEQKVHVILVHQQRAKDIETRPDKRPTREGIIGSGAWLDVCWTVMAPHLPAKWKRVPDDAMELYILKQRNGPWPIAIQFDWEPDTGQIHGGVSIPVEARGESSDEAFAGQEGKKTRGRGR